MKKTIIFWSLVFSLLPMVCLVPVLAQSKVVTKTVTKVIKPEITPTQAPKVTQEATPTLTPPPPPPPPNYQLESQKNKGVFGWGQNIDLGGFYQAGNGVYGLRANWLFSDPMQLGSKIGLAEDAVEYKLGLGLAFGSDINNNPINTVPLFFDGVVYLKEGSLFGADPFIGGGVNYNLYGTGSNFGTYGGQVYAGILADFGLASGKTRISVGYSALRVGSIRSAKGIFVGISQPITI